MTSRLVTRGCLSAVCLVLCWAFGALPAHAQEDHRLQGCTSAPTTGADENGNVIAGVRCLFDTPDGNQTVTVMFHRNTADLPGSHVAAVLDQSWINLYYSSRLQSYNPRVDFDLLCSSEFGDWNNVSEVHTGEIQLAEGYGANGGEWTDDFGCPSETPILMAALVDTIATW
jgi:hypothetical protein